MFLRRPVLIGCTLISSFSLAQIGNRQADRKTSSSKTEIAAVFSDSGNTALSSSEVTGSSVATAAMEPVLEPVRPTRFESCEQSADAAACRFHWGPALRQATQFLVIQHAMNTPTYHGTLKGPFFKDWFRSVKHYRFSRFADDDPFIVNEIGHPMMGSIVSWIEIQNDPRGTRQTVAWKKSYWKSRGKALAFASVYAVQWELGPFSETSIGNLGSFKYYSPSAKHMSNGTGFTDMLVTPTAGVTWSIGEDLIDKYVIRRIENHSRNALYLMGISMLNPTRGAANLLRMKAPWYRDTRERDHGSVDAQTP